jgi:hypothetical protein
MQEGGTIVSDKSDYFIVATIMITACVVLVAASFVIYSSMGEDMFRFPSEEWCSGWDGNTPNDFQNEHWCVKNETGWHINKTSMENLVFV